MTKVEEKAYEQARRDADEFWHEHDREEILLSYAFTCNQAKREMAKLEREERWGFTLDDEDYKRYYYYYRYSELMAYWIANSLLTAEGYERDEKGYWIV